MFQSPPRPTKKPRERGGFPSAPERTRTSTDHSVHNAHKPARARTMRPAASESPKLRGSVDGSDALDEMVVATGGLRRRSRRMHTVAAGLAAVASAHRSTESAPLGADAVVGSFHGRARRVREEGEHDERAQRGGVLGQHAGDRPDRLLHDSGADKGVAE